jgi:hypothetical protein
MLLCTLRHVYLNTHNLTSTAPLEAMHSLSMMLLLVYTVSLRRAWTSASLSSQWLFLPSISTSSDLASGAHQTHPATTKHPNDIGNCIYQRTRPLNAIIRLIYHISHAASGKPIPHQNLLTWQVQVINPFDNRTHYQPRGSQQNNGVTDIQHTGPNTISTQL